MSHKLNIVCIWLWSLIVVMTPSESQCAFEMHSGFVWTSAAGNIRVVGGNHPELCTFNPALLHDLKATRLCLNYQNIFPPLHIESASVFFAGKIDKYPVSANLCSFGDAVYREISGGAGSQFWLFPGFSVGADISLHRLEIEGYGRDVAYGISLGIHTELTQDLSMGTVLRNIMQSGRIGKDRLPEIFAIGLVWDTEYCQIRAGMEKDGYLPVNIQLGILSPERNRWQLAAGFESQSDCYSLGGRLKVIDLYLNYTWRWHPYLPSSYGVGVEFEL